MATLTAIQGTGWSNGSPSPSGAGYGTRIRKGDRDRLFDRGWPHVQLQFSDGSTTRVKLSPERLNGRSLLGGGDPTGPQTRLRQ
jgi:hypothetical protein